MGARFRKSYNFGGFRVNLSKSGIGYSWGTKGFRHTVSANGRTRNTYSIPNTGMSYISEIGTSRKQKKKEEALEYSSVAFNDPAYIASCPRNEISEPIRKMLSSLQITNFVTLTCLILSIFFPIFLFGAIIGCVVFFYIRKKKRFFFETDKEMNERLTEFFKSDKNWYVDKIFVMDKQLERKNGFPMILSRHKVTLKHRLPRYLMSDGEVACLKFNNHQIYFFKKGMLFIYDQNTPFFTGYKWSVEELSYLEDEKAPKDAQALGQRWKHQRKDGSPDGRFTDNEILTAYKYGVLNISAGDFEAMFVCSNVDNLSKFKETALTNENEGE